jgi:hypothetical protein
MTDKADELAELKAKVAALEAAQPKPQPSREERERADAEHRDWVYQMQERRMALATPPSVRQYFADGVTPADTADLARIAHAPNTPAMIPRTDQQPSDVRGNVPGSGTGWQEPLSISVPGGPRTQELIEQQVNAALPHGPEWGKGKR